MPDKIETLIVAARDAFRHAYGAEPTTAVKAPGRVNLIGEHTDYNDGFVMPIALPLVTVIVGRPIDGGGDVATLITLCADADLPHRIELDVGGRGGKESGPKWARYLQGVLVNYLGALPPAFQAVITSSVPLGAGLSSSAALEVAMYTFLDAITPSNAIMPTDKALACQKAEHDYANVPCGIMDQFISMMGKKDHALLIDCRNFTSTLIRFDDPNYKILITDSNVKHALDGSEYATRRKQCHRAALILDKLSLRDATLRDIDFLSSLNTDEAIVKRARHVVTEIQRTLDASEALKQKNFQEFGRLMNESHNSLKNDFEVSCKELDELVEIARGVNGVLGSRMTGGGFGGCTVTLVQNDAVDRTIDEIRKKYSGTPTFYVCQASDGASIINNLLN